MSIDERLEALTMNLELAFRDIQEQREHAKEVDVRLEQITVDLQKVTVGLEQVTVGLQKVTGGLQQVSDTVATLITFGQETNGRMNLMITMIGNLTEIVKDSRARIDRLENHPPS